MPGAAGKPGSVAAAAAAASMAAALALLSPGGCRPATRAAPCVGCGAGCRQAASPASCTDEWKSLRTVSRQRNKHSAAVTCTSYQPGQPLIRTLSTDMHLAITGEQQAEREQGQLIREHPLRRPDRAQSHSRAGRAPATDPARGMAASPAWPWPAGCAASTPGSVRLTCAARPQASSAAASYALRMRAGQVIASGARLAGSPA